MPPVMMTGVIPIAMSAMKQKFVETFEILTPLRKFGAITPTMAPMITTAMAIQNS